MGFFNNKNAQIEALTASFAKLAIYNVECDFITTATQEIQKDTIEIVITEEKQKEEKKSIRREFLRSTNVRVTFSEAVEVKTYQIQDKDHHTGVSTQEHSNQGKKSIETLLEMLAVVRDQRTEQTTRVQDQTNYIEELIQVGRNQANESLQAGHCSSQVQSRFNQYEAEVHAHYDPKLQRSQKDLRNIEKTFRKTIDKIMGMKASRALLQESLARQPST